MVTLFDVLSLSSCGFSSVRRFMDAEVKKALEMLTGRPIVLANNGNIGIAIDELIQRKNKKKQSKVLMSLCETPAIAGVVQFSGTPLLRMILLPRPLRALSDTATMSDKGPGPPIGGPPTSSVLLYIVCPSIF